MLRILAEGGAYQEVELGRLYYELALLLMQHFTVEMPSGTGTRAEQFTRYIEEHYNEELSLQQISEAFHMAQSDCCPTASCQAGYAGERCTVAATGAEQWVCKSGIFLSVFSGGHRKSTTGVA